MVEQCVCCDTKWRRASEKTCGRRTLSEETLLLLRDHFPGVVSVAAVVGMSVCQKHVVEAIQFKNKDASTHIQGAGGTPCTASVHSDATPMDPSVLTPLGHLTTLKGDAVACSVEDIAVFALALLSKLQDLQQPRMQDDKKVGLHMSAEPLIVGSFLVFVVPKAPKLEVKTTQTQLRCRTITSFVQAVCGGRDQGDVVTNTFIVKHLFKRRRWDPLVRGALPHVSLTCKQVMEVVGVTGITEKSLDLLGQYVSRIPGMRNPFPSWMKRQMLKNDLLKNYKTTTGEFCVADEDGVVSSMSVLLLQDLKTTVRAWLSDHQVSGHIVWQPGCPLGLIHLKLLIDKGGDHITMALACVNMLKGDSPDNVLTLGICTGSKVTTFTFVFIFIIYIYTYICIWIYTGSTFETVLRRFCVDFS